MFGFVKMTNIPTAREVSLRLILNGDTFELSTGKVIRQQVLHLREQVALALKAMVEDGRDSIDVDLTTFLPDQDQPVRYETEAVAIVESELFCLGYVVENEAGAYSMRISVPTDSAKVPRPVLRLVR